MFDCHLNITETCYFDFEPVSVSFILFISSTPLDYAGHYLCVLVYVYVYRRRVVAAIESYRVHYIQRKYITPT